MPASARSRRLRRRRRLLRDLGFPHHPAAARRVGAHGLDLADRLLRPAGAADPARRHLVLVATVVAALVLLNFVRAKAARHRRRLGDVLRRQHPLRPTRHRLLRGRRRRRRRLQHYWSLAVEEQFYLVWPLLLAVLLGALSRSASAFGSTRRPGRPLAAVADAVAGRARASPSRRLVRARCCDLTDDNPTAAYFSTLARVLGARRSAPPSPSWCRGSDGCRCRSRASMQWAGLAMIAVRVCSDSTSTTPFPGTAALLPVVGTALVLGRRVRPPSRGIAVAAREQADAGRRQLVVLAVPVALALLIIAAEYAGHSLAWQQNLLLVLAARRRCRASPTCTSRTRSAGSPAVAPPARQPAAVPDRRRGHLGRLLRSQRADPAARSPAEQRRVGDHRRTSVAMRVRRPSAPDPQQALVQASALAARNHVPIPGDLSPGLLDAGRGQGRRRRLRLRHRQYANALRARCCRQRRHHRAVRRLACPALDTGGRRDRTTERLTAYYLVKPACSAAQIDPPANDRLSSTECLAWRAWAIDQIRQLRTDDADHQRRDPGRAARRLRTARSPTTRRDRACSGRRPDRDDRPAQDGGGPDPS